MRGLPYYNKWHRFSRKAHQTTCICWYYWCDWSENLSRMTKMAMMTMMIIHVLMNMRHCLRMFKCASVKKLLVPFKMFWDISAPRNYLITFYPESNKHKKKCIFCISTCKLNSKSTCDVLNDTNRPLILWDTCVIIMIEKFASKHFC